MNTNMTTLKNKVNDRLIEVIMPIDEAIFYIRYEASLKINDGKRLIKKSFRDGAKELKQDAINAGVLIGAGVYGFYKSYYELVLKQEELADNYIRTMTTLAEEIYL